MRELNVALFTGIEDYLKNCSSRASLAQFVVSHKETTKSFIQQFDNKIQAKNNLVNKYTIAFKNVLPTRKRITGKAVYLGIPFAEARLERNIQIQMYRALEVDVSVAKRAATKNLTTNTNSTRKNATKSEVDNEKEEDTDDSREGEEDIDDGSEDEEDVVDNHNYVSNGYNMKQDFRKFRNGARRLAKSQGLFVNETYSSYCKYIHLRFTFFRVY